jgi:hypothetical protein
MQNWYNKMLESTTKNTKKFNICMIVIQVIFGPIPRFVVGEKGKVHVCGRGEG